MNGADALADFRSPEKGAGEGLFPLLFMIPEDVLFIRVHGNDPFLTVCEPYPEFKGPDLLLYTDYFTHCAAAVTTAPACKCHRYALPFTNWKYGKEPYGPHCNIPPYLNLKHSARYSISRYDYSCWKWHSIIAGIIGIPAAIPLLILLARIIETSLETIRTIYIARGHASLAGYIGITKTGIWLLSTALVLTNLSDYWNLFAYLAGYGLGTLLGIEIEKMISLGHVIVRLITPDDPQPLIANLSGLGYGMTRIEGTGSFSNTVTIIFMIVPRPELGRLMDILAKEYPTILYTVEDVRNIKEGVKIFHRDAKDRILGFFGL